MKQLQLAFRLFRLACDTRPTLPSRDLMNVLAPDIRDLISSGAKSGFNTNHAQLAQLEVIYTTGASDRPSTQEEFRELLSQAIFDTLLEAHTMDTRKRTALFAQLDAYSTSTSVIPQTRRAWNSPAPPSTHFQTGFAPLDRVLGNKVRKGVITVLAIPGDGKSYFGLALGDIWDGPVWMFDPENGEEVTLERAQTIAREKCEEKEFIFGNYDPTTILAEARADPNPNRLIILDSLHFVCGTGQNAGDAIRYARAYECAIQLAAVSKLVLITTQIKRGADGDSIDAGAASACIERHSAVLLHLKKGMLRPDLLQTYRLFASKHRTGVGGLELEYAFHYEKAQSMYIIGDEHDYKPDATKFEDWE